MNRTLKAIVAIMLMMIFAVGCNKPDEPNNGGNSGGGNNGNNDSDVRVTTYTPQDITATTAKCGGDAIVVQGLSLTEIGVCWSKEQNPIVGQTFLSTTSWNEPFVCTVGGLDPETKYYIRTYALRGLEYYYGDEKCFTTTQIGSVIGDHEYVDLGLPSGLLWANCNIGANTPGDRGDYFAWGETQPKLRYDWSNYLLCNGSWKSFYKYCDNPNYGNSGFVDNLTVLKPSDDAATINWGEDWRMPTKEDWEELLNNTTCSWTINGGHFTGPNGNSIFLPTNGYYAGETFFNSDKCVYWSSSIGTFLSNNPSEALGTINFAEEWGWTPRERCLGCSVRAVRSSK